MKSKLFVPGSRPELFPKALASAADGLSFDLEDAVVEARKPQARRDLAALLAQLATGGHDKTVVVRVNALDGGHFDEDIAAVVRPGVDWINLPKMEAADDVRRAAARIEKAAQRSGLDEIPGLLLNVESPRALRLGAELAGAHPSVMGLQLGLGDLFEPYGIARRSAFAVQQAMFALRLAAAEAGVAAFDSAFPDVRDLAGFRAEAQLARALGFAGKSCVHPTQVAAANEVFQPDDAEIAQALKVVAAAEDAAVRGVGAILVDGKMIDPPFAARARAIVAEAQRLGRIDLSAGAPGAATQEKS